MQSPRSPKSGIDPPARSSRSWRSGIDMSVVSDEPESEPEPEPESPDAGVLSSSLVELPPLAPSESSPQPARKPVRHTTTNVAMTRDLISTPRGTGTPGGRGHGHDIGASDESGVAASTPPCAGRSGAGSRTSP